jgi:hypothetical protein
VVVEASNGTWICDSESEAASTGKLSEPALAELTRPPCTLISDPGAADRALKSAAFTRRKTPVRWGAAAAYTP